MKDEVVDCNFFFLYRLMDKVDSLVKDNNNEEIRKAWVMDKVNSL
jgi:hypothetical protein